MMGDELKPLFGLKLHTPEWFQEVQRLLGAMKQTTKRLDDAPRPRRSLSAESYATLLRLLDAAPKDWREKFPIGQKIVCQEYYWLFNVPIGTPGVVEDHVPDDPKGRFLYVMFDLSAIDEPTPPEVLEYAAKHGIDLSERQHKVWMQVSPNDVLRAEE